ncbi:MAG: flagellar hook-associated protein FlgK [Pseudomonadota bacterium]
MSGMIGISLTGLSAFQAALDTTSNNIANANTPGYSRQNVNLVSRVSQGAGQVFVGSGTAVGSIARSYDGLLVGQLQSANTNVGRLETLDSLTGRVNLLLADPDTGLNSALQDFFGAVQDLSNDPTSLPTRQALIGRAEGLANRFQNADAQLSGLSSEVNERLRDTISTINNLANAIADVNGQISTSGADALPNALFDQRDRLLQDLSSLVAVQTLEQDDGSLNVFIGSGQGLVVGSTAQTLAARGSEFDPTEVRISYAADGNVTPLNDALNGGQLGGLLEFRDRILNPARESLGQTAVAFTEAFNAQHRNGMDVRGGLGRDFFAIDPPSVLYSGINTGSATASAVVSDLGAITGEDYVIQYDGSAYSVLDAATGAAVPFSGTGTAADPLLFAGVSVTVAGASAAGDRMMVRTGNGLASTVQNVVTDPQSIAIAGATTASASFSNLGDAVISSARTVDASDPDFLTTSTITFLTSTSYSVNGAGSFAYTEGAPIVINGTEVSITGIPNPGDSFAISSNVGATGDNANGLLMGDVQSVDILDGGVISINENYGRLVSDIGSTTNQVVAGLEASRAVQRNAELNVESVSGVNLDEEAAKLLQYQQAYQAAAQVISVAASLFDTVLGIAR